MSVTAADGVGWHPRVTIEKYSADQVRWAREKFAGQLHGDRLRALFREPEDGTVTDEGNGVTFYGLANLALLLTGQGGHPLAEGQAVFGVGCEGETGFSREHVHLAPGQGEDPARCWYRPMDAGFPAIGPGAGTTVEGAATFTETEACFPWHEWCWATGPGKPEAYHTLTGTYGGQRPVMINRKAHPAGYGVKEIGVAWVFRTVIELRG